MELNRTVAAGITAGALVIGVAAGAAVTNRRDRVAAPAPSPAASASPSAVPSASPSPVPVAVNDALTAVKQYGSSGLLEVTGQVTNTDKAAHGVALSATLYDKAGKTVGSGTGVVESILPGQTAAFTIISQDLVEGSGTTAKVRVTGTL